MKNSKETISPELLKVAQKFKQLRIDSGYNSQETFAYDKEINRVQYWRVEKGSNITLATFFKLLEIHKITPEEFFKEFSLTL
jgi:DNA-binding XRE family transcriptional regulator